MGERLGNFVPTKLAVHYIAVQTCNSLNIKVVAKERSGDHKTQQDSSNKNHICQHRSVQPTAVLLFFPVWTKRDNPLLKAISLRSFKAFTS